MFNCNDDICDFHNDEITLNAKQQNEMRERRDANRNRLKNGLAKNKNPKLHSHQSQGSYAMHTMVQDPNNDYDIDDGVVFLKDDLLGKQGSDKTALDARKMVRDALDDGKFSTPPEVLKNCVRVKYEKGYHVDVPVYRKMDDESLELASSDWKGSSPSKVTKWYNEAVCEKSYDESNGRQLRRVTKHIKAYKNSRQSWKSSMASGFIISKLVVDNYVSDNRDDVSLYKTMNAIHETLKENLEVSHPVRDEMLTKGADDSHTKFLRNKLSEAVNHLNVLFDDDCTLLQALQAWKNVFKHQFWTDRIDDEENNNLQHNAANIPTVVATKPWLNNSGYMMKFTSNDLQEINKIFPKLQLVKDEIHGQIDFCAKYLQDKRGQWVIESCKYRKNAGCVTGQYNIRITVDSLGV